MNNGKREQRRERGRAKMSVWGRCVSVCLSAVLLLTGCSTIDDDLSDCGADYQMNYHLQLVTNIDNELQTQLTTETEVRVGNALRNHLNGIFANFAHDIDLSFFGTEGEDELLWHTEEAMDASDKTFTFYLPMRQYRHLALANLLNNSQVSAEGGEQGQTLHLGQKEGNKVESHETGLFTARTDMDVKEGVDQTFNVSLYMANSAAALVLDPRGNDVSSIQVYSTGFATGFNVNDSTYTFAEKSPFIHAQEVATGTDQQCFCSVNFPSRDVVEGNEPFWQFYVYVTKNDGTITETVLNVYKPLKAGELQIIKAYLDEDGVAYPTDATVGVSVTLDWNSGGEHDIEL